MILIVFIVLFNHCFILLQLNAVLMIHFVASPTHTRLHLKANVQIFRTDSEGAAGAHADSSHGSYLRSLCHQAGVLPCAALSAHPGARFPGPATHDGPQDVAAEMHRVHSASLPSVSLITMAYLCPVLRFPSPTRDGDESWAVSLTQGREAQPLSRFSIPLASRYP